MFIARTFYPCNVFQCELFQNATSLTIAEQVTYVHLFTLKGVEHDDPLA